MSLVSVIIPCYNSEKWIEECLLSVIKQTYKYLEIIIIDDGSEDNTLQIVKKFNDARIKYYYKKNGGVSSARNYGIDKSNGNWIAFLDSDDIWAEKKIETQLFKIGDFSGIFSNYCLIDENNNKIISNHNIHPALYNYNFKIDIIKHNQIAGGSTMLLKKSLIEKVGYFNENLKVGEDWEYWARILWSDFKLKYCKEALTKIRVHRESAQKTIIDEIWFYSYDLIYNSFLKFKNINKSEKGIIYKQLIKISYRFNTSFYTYKKNYFSLLKNQWKYIFDIELIWLTTKFCFKKKLKKL